MLKKILVSFFVYFEILNVINGGVKCVFKFEERGNF